MPADYIIGFMKRRTKSQQLEKIELEKKAEKPKKLHFQNSVKKVSNVRKLSTPRTTDEIENFKEIHNHSPVATFFAENSSEIQRYIIQLRNTEGMNPRSIINRVGMFTKEIDKLNDMISKSDYKMSDEEDILFSKLLGYYEELMNEFDSKMFGQDDDIG